MKTLQFIVSLIFLAGCTDRESKTNDISKIAYADTIIKHDTVFYNNDNNWQDGFGLTHDPDKDSIWGKPVKFYIDNPKCSPIAIDFYTGQFQPTDNNTTAALLKLATTNDNNLRPFYRWCLNKTIQIQDGALAEYTGVPARQYAEKFPKEFFTYMDIDTTKEKYNSWANAISYSGFYDVDDYKKPQDIRKRLTQTMNENCINCSEQLEKRIDKFAKDCFE
ncbi:MAG: hypothetical protein QM668_15400 [Agriterribacter sp.]